MHNTSIAHKICGECQQFGSPMDETVLVAAEPVPAEPGVPVPEPYFWSPSHMYFPDIKRRLTRDSRQPGPTSWKSIPDNVVPSQLNWEDIVEELEGPFSTSNLASMEPTPLFSVCWESSVNFHIIRLFSVGLKTSATFILRQLHGTQKWEN